MTEKHWMFKNAREWTEDEITQLIMDEVGKDVFRPAGSNLLIKLCKKPEKTAGGIIMPNTDQDIFYSRIGRVLAMGSHCYDEDRFPKGPYCHIGDYITFQQYQWERVPISNVELYVLPCNKITGIVPGPEGLII
jgi:co-chaperonin GroES (HSP10)